jgi:cell division protease FtsH
MWSALGGRAAEQIIFGKISTGALSDLEKVTKQAYAMVSYYGLDESIGNVSFYDSSGQSEYAMSKPYSEKTAERIDNAVSDLIERMYQKTITLLENNKDKLTTLAETLLEKEVIFKDDLELIFGKRSFPADVLKEKIIKDESSKNEELESDKETASTNSEEPATTDRIESKLADDANVESIEIKTED